MGKYSKVSSATKWKLGENVVLRLMEYLTPTVSFDIFMDNYFTSFRLLADHGVNTRQHVCSAKLGYPNALSLGTNGCKKRNVVTLKSTHQEEKQFNFDSGWLERQQCGLHSFL